MPRKNKKLKGEDVHVTLPCELEEEILSRLPPLSLARFRSVCKQWNALCNENRFINNHFARPRPQFIFITNSNIYSIEIISLDGVDPTIKLRELPSSRTAYRELNLDYITITTCDGLLFCNYSDYPKVTALWNPWLKQVKWIECNDKYFDVSGVGYDNTRPEKVYKILGSFISDCKVERVAIYECASHAFKSIDSFNEQCPLSQVKRFSVPLNGNLYWRTRFPHTLDFYIRSFDFSRDIFKHFCLLPCRENHFRDQLVLGVYKGDRLSLLKQCYVTRSVEIWVTKKKIDSNNNGTDEVVWIKLLTLPTNNLPNLYNKCYGISYFIYDKTTLIMCCGEDVGGTAFIYIVRRDLFKKIPIDSGVFRCCHCLYAPNFIPVPLDSDCKSNNLSSCCGRALLADARGNFEFMLRSAFVLLCGGFIPSRRSFRFVQIYLLACCYVSFFFCFIVFWSFLLLVSLCNRLSQIKMV